MLRPYGRVQRILHGSGPYHTEEGNWAAHAEEARGPTDGDRAWMDAWMGGAPGRYPKPNRDSVHFRCGCMSERVIDTWSLTVLRLPDERTPVPSDRNEGTPMYPMRGDAAEYLNLAAGPTVYCYPLSEGEHGDDMLISKRRLSDDIVGRVRRAMRQPEA